ncbi:allophanate hydrolase [Ectobacillus funiculus]|uniref:allophanate hydrolase n=1 Tax=Ectobacillus funiculus TaxID=137993 RepID=UPI00101D5847|nr:allophanate hydrolase [Ectobacillus funiculus]
MSIVQYPETLSIEWLHDMYAKKAITPKDVIDEIIKRANRDSEMNIWITPPSAEVLQPYIERLESLSTDLPLWGIPFAVKDNIDVAGMPTTAACPEYTYIPLQHATVVERFVAAGAIPVGKTNLDQFATGLVGTRSPYGETHNALWPELISGGSSGGSAVAVARGQAAFSLGTDTAGSGRVPAALNRLVGYKPSLGAWSTKGVVPACASLDCITVFAHSTTDAMIVDSIARGIDDENPWSRNIPMPSTALPEKIYLPKQPLSFFGPFAAEYERAWERTVEQLKQLNIPIEYLDYEFFAEAAAILYDGPLVAERWADLSEFIESHPGVTFPVTEQVLRSGAADKHTAASLFHAMHKLQTFKLAARKQLGNAVLVTPTAGGTWTRDEVRSNPISANSDMGRFTNHCNLLDLCAIAVPADDAAPQLPFGITFFSLWDQEGLIYGAANMFTNNAKLLKQETTLVAVCGLHMRGFPLEKQMKECGATFIREAATAAKYKFVKLSTSPAKPGLIKTENGGASIELELWEMPLSSFGVFAASIPAPLGIGKVELQDGSEVPGFICEAYAAADAENITALGSWRNAIAEPVEARR